MQLAVVYSPMPATATTAHYDIWHVEADGVPVTMLERNGYRTWDHILFGDRAGAEFAVERIKEIGIEAFRDEATPPDGFED